MQQQKKIPPFGKILQAFHDIQFPIYIFVGRHAKEEAFLSKSHGVLCSFVPHGHEFSDFVWPLKNQSVVLFDTGGSSLISLNKICAEILSIGAKSCCRYSDIAPIEVFI